MGLVENVQRLQKIKRWLSENEYAAEHLKLPEAAVKMLRDEAERLTLIFDDLAEDQRRQDRYEHLQNKKYDKQE